MARGTLGTRLICLFDFVLKPECSRDNVSVAKPGVGGVRGGRGERGMGRGEVSQSEKLIGWKSPDVVPPGLGIPQLAECRAGHHPSTSTKWGQFVPWDPRRSCHEDRRE